MQSRFAIASVFSVAALLAQPALATPADVCALLQPFFADPPKHFADLRGPKSSDNAWHSKANTQADALNATCGLTAYIEHRVDYDCKTVFDAGAIADQQAFYADAKVGIDYCLGSLGFGTRVRRSEEFSNSTNLDTESVSWWRTQEKDGQDQAEFGVAVTKNLNKNPDNRSVDITIYYSAVDLK
jgi:hypothetical protein